ncbi:MAG: 4Fe-4S dicluster domain-containing protein [Alphaproteobacteria bacterium]|nr:4Fe-4S dicluster domain-containing protein [Alphaproteobacteria bacterium]
MPAVCIDRADFDSVIKALAGDGYNVVGPVLREGAIIYDEISGVSDLPEGWGDEQEAGTYRTVKRNDKALFGHNSGQQAWKKFLYPSRERLWSAQGDNAEFKIEPNAETPPKYAFVGVHACDLRAIEIQDIVFMNPETADPRYGKRREGAFIVAVNCAQSAKTCFCAAMGTGPRAESGFDLSLTEIIEANAHYFVATVGSARGETLMQKIKSRPATDADLQAAATRTENAQKQQVRSLDREGVKELLFSSYSDAHWDKIAERCLSCANCTMVCPTCFCSKTEDTTDLSGNHADRWRLWDSCFTVDFSYIHGGSIRKQVASRYRQWMTHKLASWIDQFGTSGCVGCGRCITWCPVGIDITEEAKVFREEKMDPRLRGDDEVVKGTKQ